MNSSPYFHTWFPGEQGYKEHIDRKIYSNDNILAIQEQTKQLKRALSQQMQSNIDQTQKLVATNEQIISAIDNGFNRLSQINQQGFNRVVGAIEDLHSDMIYCLGTVIHLLEFQNSLLTSILGTLKTPERTKVEELYNEGCLQAKGGLLNYAIDYLKKSISIETGFTFYPSHYKLGLLYLIGEGGTTDIINPKEATLYLLKANELGTGLWKVNSNFSSELANCKFFLSQSYYYQLKGKTSTEELNLINNAIKYVDESIGLNSGFSQGLYHLAKYLSYRSYLSPSYRNEDEIEKILIALMKAIEIDRNYLRTLMQNDFIMYDRALEPVSEDINNLVSRLTDIKRKDANSLLTKAQNYLSMLDEINTSQSSECSPKYFQLRKIVETAEQDFKTKTYYGYDDCIIKLEVL